MMLTVASNVMLPVMFTSLWTLSRYRSAPSRLYQRHRDRNVAAATVRQSLSSGRLHLLLLVRSTRALQDCSDRVLAEPDMAADQAVAQTSLCQLEDLRRLAVLVGGRAAYRGSWRGRT